MLKRVAAGALWFVATLWLFNFAGAYLGVPSLVGFVVAAAVGGFIGGDPLKLYWRTQRRTVAVAPVAAREFVTAPQPTR
jgi:hypothetical protein